VKRVVVVGIDDLCRIFADYLGPEHLPDDIQPTKFRVSPGERKLEVVVESEAWDGDQGRMRVDFEIRRVFAVGGKADG
jgi:hypothetical protein